MSEQIDCAVIGAGSVGLAGAWRPTAAKSSGDRRSFRHPHQRAQLQSHPRRHPGYTVIRRRITGPGEPVQDFRFSGSREHGIPELVNPYGIEPSGLTSSLAIADHVPDYCPEAPQ